MSGAFITMTDPLVKSAKSVASLYVNMKRIIAKSTTSDQQGEFIISKIKMKAGDKFIRYVEDDHAQVITYAGKKEVKYLFKAKYHGKTVRFYRTLKEIKRLDYKLVKEKTK